MATFNLPKGWVRAPGDSYAMVWRAPSGPQDLRVAKIGRPPDFGAGGMEKLKAMVTSMAPANSVVTQTQVCNGTQPAIRTVVKNADGKITMEQVVVMGNLGGAIVTYEIPDALPDPGAENALSTICWP